VTFFRRPISAVLLSTAIILPPVPVLCSTRSKACAMAHLVAKHGVATISPSTAGGGVRTCAANLSRARHQFVLDATMAST
jgi:hypothetical protein